VDGEVPKEAGGDEPPPDPLQEAERAFENHEGDLVERIIELAERGIPEKATVREAMIEMHRSMREDPETRELIERLALMTHYGGGKVARNWPQWWRENRPQD
jgi:hypothetical protein